jgi:hypothetical protein
VSRLNEIRLSIFRMPARAVDTPNNPNKQPLGTESSLGDEQQLLAFGRLAQLSPAQPRITRHIYIEPERRSTVDHNTRRVTASVLFLSGHDTQVTQRETQPNLIGSTAQHLWLGKANLLWKSIRSVRTSSSAYPESSYSETAVGA